MHEKVKRNYYILNNCWVELINVANKNKTLQINVHKVNMYKVSCQFTVELYQ